MARGASHVTAAKGKKVTQFDMKQDSPTDEELTTAMMGPSGNLRAPTIRRGKKLFIGFHEDELAAFLK